MRKNYIVIGIFIICLCLVGYTGYYLGSTTIEPKVVETVVEKEPNIDEIKELVKTEIYDDAYNEGYEKGKTEVFELMLESENIKDIETTESTETVNTITNTDMIDNQASTNQSSTSNTTNNNYTNTDDEWRADTWNDTPTDDFPGQPNGDGSYTIHNPSVSADSITWSISADGMLPGNFWSKAMSNLHYYDYSYNDLHATSGFLISVNPDEPGVYSIHWENSDGSLSCDQTVTLTE